MGTGFRFLFFLAVFIVLTGSLFGQVPPAPTNLSVVPGILGTAVLHWDADTNAVFFRVYGSIDDSPFVKIGETPRKIFMVDNLFPHRQYQFFVTGVDTAGEGPASDTVSFMLDHMPPPPVFGTVQGFVLDSATGLPVKNAEVDFFSTHKLWSVPIHTDSAGSYSVRLDTGNYLVRASKFQYKTVWYNGTMRIDSAMVVKVLQDSVFTANFVLPPIMPPGFSTVTGTVYDSTNGQPLKNAAVFFMRPYHEFKRLEDAVGTIGGLLAERLDYDELGRLYGVVWAGITDSNGEYSAHVLTGLHYVAMAYKPGYLPRFWDDKASYFHATVFQVVSDTSGFDFHLLPLLPTNNSLSGDVQDTSGIGVPAHVLLFRHTPAGFVPVRYQMTDSLGNFNFRNVISGGVFILKAYPIGGYSPAWYSASACGVRNWHNADTIHDVGAVTGVNICVMPAPEGGFSTISGLINAPSQTPGVKKNAPMTTSPLGDVTVYALSADSGQVLAVDVSAPDGSFELDNVPAGAYTLDVDREGYSMSGGSPSVTVDASNNYQNSGNVVNVSPDQVTAVKEPGTGLPTVFRLDQNYPNPFNPTTQIRFALPVQSNVTVRVYNLIGQEVAVLVNENRAAGYHVVSWNGINAGGLPAASGVYFVRMSATPLVGNDRSPYNETRKMVLLK